MWVGKAIWSTGFGQLYPCSRQHISYVLSVTQANNWKNSGTRPSSTNKPILKEWSGDSRPGDNQSKGSKVIESSREDQRQNTPPTRRSQKNRWRLLGVRAHSTRRQTMDIRNHSTVPIQSADKGRRTRQPRAKHCRPSGCNTSIIANTATATSQKPGTYIWTFPRAINWTFQRGILT